MKYIVLFLSLFLFACDSEWYEDLNCSISEMKCQGDTVMMCKGKYWQEVMWCGDYNETCTTNSVDCRTNLFSGIACCKEVK